MSYAIHPFPLWPFPVMQSDAGCWSWWHRTGKFTGEWKPVTNAGELDYVAGRLADAERVKAENHAINARFKARAWLTRKR